MKYESVIIIYRSIASKIPEQSIRKEQQQSMLLRVDFHGR